MKETWTAARRRKLAWLVGGGASFIVALPLVPAMASAFAGSSSGSTAQAAAPSLVHVEVVARGAAAGAGQIQLPAAGTPLFVACPRGQALDGGYRLPDVPGVDHGTLLESAPDETHPERWNFRFSGALPVGTKLYAACWGN